MMDMMDMMEFHNLLRVIRSIDQIEVPFLSARQWESFRDGPENFFIRADDETATAIWEAMQRRVTR